MRSATRAADVITPLAVRGVTSLRVVAGDDVYALKRLAGGCCGLSSVRLGEGLLSSRDAVDDVMAVGALVGLSVLMVLKVRLGGAAESKSEKSYGSAAFGGVTPRRDAPPPDAAPVPLAGALAGACAESPLCCIGSVWLRADAAPVETKG